MFALCLCVLIKKSLWHGWRFKRCCFFWKVLCAQLQCKSWETRLFRGFPIPRRQQKKHRWEQEVIVGRGLGYNLASGTKLHCLLWESAESTEVLEQLRKWAVRQTQAYTRSRAWKKTGFKRPLRSHHKEEKRHIITDEWKDAILGPTSLFP